VFKIDTKEDALVYILVVDDIQKFNCPSTSITGKVQNNTVYYLAVKRCKGCRKILALWNAKSIGRK
jgi:hypothetical protein